MARKWLVTMGKEIYRECSQEKRIATTPKRRAIHHFSKWRAWEDSNPRLTD